MSFKMPTPLALGEVSPGTSIERSFSSSSLRESPSKQGSGRTPQKSFGRQPARVAAAPVSPVVSAPAPAPSVTPSEVSSSITLSVDDTALFARRLRDETARDLPTIEDEGDLHEQENAGLRVELETLRQELQDLREASSKVTPACKQLRVWNGRSNYSDRARRPSEQNDDVWQRDNARLKEQLATANAREAAQQEQQEQLRIRDDQLALSRQEVRELQDKVEADRTAATHAPPAPAPAEEAGSSGLGRERDLLKLVVQLVGASNVRAVLRETPNASPGQLRDALVRLRCPQCRHLSPSRSSSPTKATGTGHVGSLHQMLFGTSSRPPSPTALRFNSTGSRSPHLQQ
ncbi:hypothetical protein PHYPSEUDO_002166 [Phytophthora pseudosyringae]|uniref:Uncharacterized protein n=1 Tax=Phytophthora pseudosyringae TaxID=221518 RepID=A0A8T1VUF0_9STRA|nr:hypothetical protein PHYPSEUDO_002166 [Phytophthora pseudosyringae]